MKNKQKTKYYPEVVAPVLFLTGMITGIAQTFFEDSLINLFILSAGLFLYFLTFMWFLHELRGATQ